MEERGAGWPLFVLEGVAREVVQEKQQEPTALHAGEMVFIKYAVIMGIASQPQEKSLAHKTINSILIL